MHCILQKCLNFFQPIISLYIFSCTLFVVCCLLIHNSHNVDFCCLHLCCHFILCIILFSMCVCINLKTFNVSTFILQCRKSGSSYLWVTRKTFRSTKKNNTFLFSPSGAGDLWEEVSTETNSFFEISLVAATRYNAHISNDVWRKQ